MQESRTFTMRYSNHIVDETTHAFKCAKWFALVSSLLLGIFGTVLLIWPNTSMNVICTLLGVLMVVFGVSKIVGYFFNVSYHIGFQFDLALGLFALLFGILCHRLFAVWYFPDLQPCKRRQPVRSGHGHFADLRRN